jgi:hypothetical protein
MWIKVLVSAQPVLVRRFWIYYLPDICPLLGWPGLVSGHCIADAVIRFQYERHHPFFVGLNHDHAPCSI